jgi:hypothetical protein
MDTSEAVWRELVFPTLLLDDDPKDDYSDQNDGSESHDFSRIRVVNLRGNSKRAYMVGLLRQIALFIGN